MPDADYNVAPTTHQLTIRQSKETGDRELILARWGLVPFFTKDLTDGKGLSTTEAKTWRELMRRPPRPQKTEICPFSSNGQTCVATSIRFVLRCSCHTSEEGRTHELGSCGLSRKLAVGLAVLRWGGPAEFPSPAEDYLETKLNLTEYLVENKAATFMMRVDGVR